MARLVGLKLAEKYVSIKCAALMSNPFCLKNKAGNWCCYNNFIMRKVGGFSGFLSLSTEHFLTCGINYNQSLSLMVIDQNRVSVGGAHDQGYRHFSSYLKTIHGNVVSMWPVCQAISKHEKSIKLQPKYSKLTGCRWGGGRSAG